MPKRKPNHSTFDFDTLTITSPKRNAHAQSGWDGFFPYYAGYPEQFARALLESAELPPNATVLDPWNGSGTTTFAASQIGLHSVGLDLNPVMAIVARARSLPSSEADSIRPLIREMIKKLPANTEIDADDPLLWWFNRPSAATIRAIEKSMREHLIGERTLTPHGVRLDNISGLAATFYVALFSVCRRLATRYQTSNPTWMRRPSADERRIGPRRDTILRQIETCLANMADALAGRDCRMAIERAPAPVELLIADTTTHAFPAASIDLVLTSPPYCTRIDYSAATRIELAILRPLAMLEMEDLGRRMMGSTRVPSDPVGVDAAWGDTCAKFLKKVRNHRSKASGGYYLKTHLDYFNKMARSLGNIGAALRPGGAAILVVQDSFYKDVHNDLPMITVEMAKSTGLALRRREDFVLKRSMADINPNARRYKRKPGAVEAVLCFEKI